MKKHRQRGVYPLKREVVGWVKESPSLGNRWARALSERCIRWSVRRPVMFLFEKPLSKLKTDWKWFMKLLNNWETECIMTESNSGRLSSLGDVRAECRSVG